MSWLQFETNNICGGGCTFCPHGTNLFPHRHEMTMDTIIKILSEAPKVDFVYPFLYQEPLLEKRLYSILNLCKALQPQAKTAIYTTLQGCTCDKARWLISSGLLDEIIISFYGHDKETHDRLQPNIDYDRTVQRINGLAKLKKINGRGPLLKIHTIAMPELLSHYSEFRKQWAEKVDWMGVVPYDDYRGKIQAPPVHYTTSKPRGPCERIWHGMNVLSDGSFVPCCLDFAGEAPMGNVNDEKFIDIWNGPKFRELRQMHLDLRFDEIPLCKDCTVWKYS